MKIYAYPARRPHDGYRISTIAKAQETISMLQQISNDQLPIKCKTYDEREDDTTIETELKKNPDPSQKILINIPHYNYTYSEQNAKRLRDKSINDPYHPIPAGFPIIEVEVNILFVVSEQRYNSAYIEDERKVAIEGIFPIPCEDIKEQKIKYIEIPFSLNVDFSHIPIISKDAEDILGDYHGGDSSTHPNSYSKVEFVKLLAGINKKVSEKVIVESGNNRPYSGHTITEYIFQMNSGKTLTLYVYSIGYCEGYGWDCFLDKKSAFRHYYQAVNRHDWTEIECWECGATFDEPGHVEPGQMGCDRCNN